MKNIGGFFWRNLLTVGLNELDDRRAIIQKTGARECNQLNVTAGQRGGNVPNRYPDRIR